MLLAAPAGAAAASPFEMKVSFLGPSDAGKNSSMKAWGQFFKL
jgi:hypothetical protein